MVRRCGTRTSSHPRVWQDLCITRKLATADQLAAIDRRMQAIVSLLPSDLRGSLLIKTAWSESKDGRRATPLSATMPP